MRIKSERFGQIEIPVAVTTYLRRYCQKRGAAETGGALGGYFQKGGRLVISHVMPPSPRNKAGVFWLKRHRGDAQTFVNSVFSDTKGAANYVGEWHTHPEPHPTPSGHDYKMMADLLKRSKLEISFLVGIILGDTGEICVWLQDSAKGKREVFPAAHR